MQDMRQAEVKCDSCENEATYVHYHVADPNEYACDNHTCGYDQPIAREQK